MKGIYFLTFLSPCNHYFDHFMFVRTREDTVRCIVTSLTDENSTELAEVTGNKFFIASYKLHEVSLHVYNCIFCGSAKCCLNMVSKVEIDCHENIMYLEFMTNLAVILFIGINARRSSYH